MKSISSTVCPHCHQVFDEWSLECEVCFARLDVEPGSNIPVLAFNFKRGTELSASTH